ncbi:MAG: hypothetical protein B6D37_11560 [Sphingobacteriales bacterium UTBCD1]|jgi:serine protease Do|nr:MAG: hypothetical protein B6D37_11560 [Sphingobacteriales bacterium UTBCD1]
MKCAVKKISVVAIGFAMLAPVSVMAQKENNQEQKNARNNSETEVITITRKGDKDQKTTVEISGDKITVNGKPIEDMKGGDITVRRNIIRNYRGNPDNRRGDGAVTVIGTPGNSAMLGVTTKKTDGGAAIQDVTDGSAAQKAGLKENDVITKIDDHKISDPDDLSKAIGQYKPGDKVKVTFLRDNKEQSVTAELTKWAGINLYDNRNEVYGFKMPDINYEELAPKIEQMMPRLQGRNWDQMFNTTTGRPRLGLSVQDTENGKGAKVIDVDDDSNAGKAGIKEGDVITEIDGKAVNSADEVAKVVRDSKDKNSLMFKIQRNGKTQNIEVKIPRKLKTADL